MVASTWRRALSHRTSNVTAARLTAISPAILVVIEPPIIARLHHSESLRATESSFTKIVKDFCNKIGPFRLFVPTHQCGSNQRRADLTATRDFNYVRRPSASSAPPFRDLVSR
jgi:hypothetical protein